MDDEQWFDEQAVRLLACPRCQAAVGQACCTPKGRQVLPHQARLAALTAQPWLYHAELLKRHGIPEPRNPRLRRNQEQTA